MKRLSINRIKTGIKGFDNLVEGGFPEGSCVLACGTPGTGKTIFGMEYIYRGATKFNQKGIYVSFEQSAKEIRSQGLLFGFDIAPFEKKGLIKLMSIPVRDVDETTIEQVKSEIIKMDAKRVVIDSLSTLSVNAPIYTSMKDMSVLDIVKEKSVFSPPILGDFIVKKFIYGFIADLKAIDPITCILISEASEKGEYLSRDTISEFICDGVLLFTFESMGGDYSRSLLVRKMRRTKNDEDIHPLQISNNGLVVHTIK